METDYLKKMLKGMRFRYALRWTINALLLALLGFLATKIIANTTYDEFLDHTLSIVLTVVSAVIFIFTFLMEPLFLSKNKVKEILDSPPNFYELTVVNKGTGEVDQGLNYSLDKLGEDEIRYYSIYHRSARINGVSWFIADLLFLIGTAISIIEAEVLYFYGTLILVALLLVIRHPRQKKIKTQMAAIKKENRWN